MFKDVNRDTYSLDAEQFKDDESVYELARVLSDEVEAMRAARDEQKGASKNMLFVILNRRQWYHYATDTDLLKRCSARLKLPLRLLAERIYRELSPPNWEIFFWMHAYLEAVIDQVNGELEFARREADAKRLARSELGRQGADKTHAENRAIKSEVFAWLDENMSRFRSMDAAAQEISSNIAPVAFRTARDWVGQWKKVRSAAKA